MDFEQGLSRMAALCSTSEHCESEIREKLQKAAMSVADIDRIVDRLYEEEFLDDARYCRAFSLDKLRFAHWGRVKIAQALRMKGLPQADITTALDELPQEEYDEVLASLLAQKARTLHDEDEYTRRCKLIRFALGRGFTMDEIEKINMNDEIMHLLEDNIDKNKRF